MHDKIYYGRHILGISGMCLPQKHVFLSKKPIMADTFLESAGCVCRRNMFFILGSQLWQTHSWNQRDVSAAETYFSYQEANYGRHIPGISGMCLPQKHIFHIRKPIMADTFLESAGCVCRRNMFFILGSQLWQTHS